MTDQSSGDGVQMRESVCEFCQHFFGFGDMEPANVFQFNAARNLFRLCLGKKAEHQGLRKRPGLRTKVADILHFDPALLLDFAEHRFFESLTGFYEAGQGRIHSLRPGSLPSEKTQITRVNEHDGRRIRARKMFVCTIWICATHDVSRLFRDRWKTTTMAKFLLLVPIGQRAGVKKRRTLFYG